MEAVIEKVSNKKYPVYKDSGEAWIGEIPEHWAVRKLKLLFTEKKIKHNPSLSCGAISFGKVIEKDDEKIPYSTKASYQEVLAGEFLINPLNLNYDLISLRIALSYINVVVSSGYIVLKNIADLNKEYFKYLLHRYDVAYMKLLGSGVRQTISFNHIANSLLIAPPIEEQNTIARFLDEKTALIDKAIAIKEQQIELLKERRQILIQRVVTRGLNPNVKMKDSGVEWIGEIPEHWEVKKLTYITKFITCGLASTPTYVDPESGKPFLSAQNVRSFRMDYNKFNYISVRLHKDLTAIRKVKKGDILLTRVGAGIGDVAIFNEEIDCAVYVSLTHLRVVEEISNRFIMYFLGSHSAKMMHEAGTVLAGGQGNLNVNNLRKYRFAIPPKEEQYKIVGFLEKSLEEIGLAIFLKEREIEKLKEYKASLINSAVTGKIKVC